MEATPLTPLISENNISSNMTKQKDGDLNTNIDFLFYNSDSTMDINRDVAKGFLILLTVGNPDEKVKKNNKHNTVNNKSVPNNTNDTSSTSNSNNNNNNIDDDNNSILFPFTVLTDGNIIDACFGDQPQGGIKFAGSTYAVKAAKRAKQILKEVADSGMDSQLDYKNKEIAVNAYRQCLEIVMEFHDKMEELGIVSWCWKASSIRKKAEEDLRESFSSLKQAALQSKLSL